MAVRYVDHPVRFARQKMRLDAGTLAAAAGMTQQQVYDIERGRRVRVYVHEMLALSRVLGLDLMDLLSPENCTGRPKTPHPRRVRRRKKTT
jgi:transcriptional regulator with XRE-family HTH domain